MALLSSARRSTALAPPLPISNRILNSAGVVLRRGQFSMLAAAPSVGKSTVARNLCIFSRDVRSLYFSADTDEYTVRKNAISVLTGSPLNQVDSQLESESWDSYYNNKLTEVDHVDWQYGTDVDPETIALQMNAYSERWGDYPDLVVVDSLGNTVEDDENEIAELKANCRELHRMARATKCHIMALHHLTGEYEDGDKPVTLKALKGKVGQWPELAIGLSWPRGKEAGALLMTVPKNRNGERGLQIEVPIDYATGLIGGCR